MAAKLLTGKEVAQKMDQDIQAEVQALKGKGINPALKIMIVGDAPDSLAYANSAKKMAEKNGIACDIEQLPGTTGQDEFVKILKARNADKAIHGIIVMRPFPKQISEDVVKHILAPEKDIDCFNPVNAGKVMAGDMTGFPPATPQAVMEMLRFYTIPMSGKEAVVIGRSMVVGKPQVHAAPGRECNGHRLPLTDPGPAGSLPPRRHPRGGHRQGKDDHAELHQAGRHGHGRGHQRRRATNCSATWTRSRPRRSPAPSPRCRAAWARSPRGCS